MMEFRYDFCFFLFFFFKIWVNNAIQFFLKLIQQKNYFPQGTKNAIDLVILCYLSKNQFPTAVDASVPLTRMEENKSVSST